MALMGEDSDACPYQGLAPFGTDEAELFFGRTRATRGLLDRLGPRLDEGGSILVVSGASGVGKSSLLRAGLMPALAKGMLPVAGSRSWPRLFMTPTATPLRTLAETWTGAYGGRVEEERARVPPEHLDEIGALGVAEPGRALGVDRDRARPARDPLHGLEVLLPRVDDVMLRHAVPSSGLPGAR